MSSQSFIILKQQVVSTTAETPETKSNKSGSLKPETETISKAGEHLFLSQ